MILTSHYMEDIESLCERIVIIREGSFVFDGPLKKIKSDFAKHKILTARVEGSGAVVMPWPDSLYSEVISKDAGLLKLRVLREKVPELAALVLKNLSVIDLSIDEEDIGSIISVMMRQDLKP